METALWLILDTLSNLSDQVLFLYLLNQQVPRKKSNYLKDIGVIIVLVSCLTLLQKLELPFVVRYSTMFAIQMSYSLFFREGSVFQRIFWPIISRIALFCVDNATTFFFQMIPGFDFVLLISNTPHRLLGMSFYLFFCIVVFYVLANSTPRKRNMSKQTLVSSIFMAVVCVVFSGLVFDFLPSAMVSEAAWLASIATVGFMVISVAWLFILNTLSIRNEELLALQLEKQRMETEQEYAEKMQLIYDDMRSLRHDFRNHLLALNGLVLGKDFDGLSSYLDNLQDIVAPSEMLSLSKHPSFDAIISAKLQQAYEMNFSPEVFLSLPIDLPLSIFDLCSLTGNVLDNALEALDEVPQENRYLSIRAEQISAMWRLRVENSCQGMYKKANDKLLTTKQGAWHGIGLRKVEKITEENGGFVSIVPATDRFIIEIFFPLIEIDLSDS